MDLAVHHIGIVVNDIDRAKEVFEKAFGLEIKGRYVVDEFKAECAFMLMETRIWNLSSLWPMTG